MGNDSQQINKNDWASVLRNIELDSRVAKLRPRPQSHAANIYDYLQYCNFLQYCIKKEGAFTPKKFLHQLCVSVDLERFTTENTNYKKISFDNNLILEYRLSRHQSNCETFIIKHSNCALNFGIVIKDSKNQFKHHPGVNYIEFVYFSDKMNDANRQIQVIEGFKTLISSASVIDMPEPNKLNTSGVFRKIIKTWPIDGKLQGVFDTWQYSYQERAQELQELKTNKIVNAVKTKLAELKRRNSVLAMRLKRIEEAENGMYDLHNPLLKKLAIANNSSEQDYLQYVKSRFEFIAKEEQNKNPYIHERALKIISNLKSATR